MPLSNAERQRRWQERLKTHAQAAADVEALKAEREQRQAELKAIKEKWALDLQRMKKEYTALRSGSHTHWTFEQNRLNAEIAVLREQLEIAKRDARAAALAEWKEERRKLQQELRTLRVMLDVAKKVEQDLRDRLWTLVGHSGDAPGRAGGRLPEAVGEKLTKLLPMLSSDNDGEALNAVRAIERALKDKGFSWLDVAACFGRSEQATPRKSARRR